MEFEEWAEQYALDDEPCTRQSRRQDCAAAWEAAATATRKTCEVACSQALEYAKGAEREACAQLAEDHLCGDYAGLPLAIRKRSNA